MAEGGLQELDGEPVNLAVEPGATDMLAAEALLLAGRDRKDAEARQPPPHTVPAKRKGQTRAPGTRKRGRYDLPGPEGKPALPGTEPAEERCSPLPGKEGETTARQGKADKQLNMWQFVSKVSDTPIQPVLVPEAIRPGSGVELPEEGEGPMVGLEGKTVVLKELPLPSTPACLGQEGKNGLPRVPSSGISVKTSTELGHTTLRPCTANTVQLSICYYPGVCEENAGLGETYLSLITEKKRKEDDCEYMAPFCIYENKTCSTHNIPLRCIQMKTRKWRQGKNGLYRYVTSLNEKWICPARLNSQKIAKPLHSISGERKGPEQKLAIIFRKFEKWKRD